MDKLVREVHLQDVRFEVVEETWWSHCRWNHHPSLSLSVLLYKSLQGETKCNPLREKENLIVNVEESTSCVYNSPAFNFFQTFHQTPGGYQSSEKFVPYSLG